MHSKHSPLARLSVILALLLIGALFVSGCSDTRAGQTGSTTTTTTTTTTTPGTVTSPGSTMGNTASGGTDSTTGVPGNATSSTSGTTTGMNTTTSGSDATGTGSSAAGAGSSSTADTAATRYRDTASQATNPSGGSTIGTTARQGTNAWTPTDNTPMTASRFTLAASQSNIAEIALANLASHKSSSAAVQQYAEHILTDHEQAGEQLKSVASQNGQKVSTSMDAQDQRTFDQLSKLNGPAFDRAFVTAMIQDHQKAVNIFEQASNELPQGALKSFASSTLPTLQQHLSHAQQLDQQISTAGE